MPDALTSPPPKNDNGYDLVSLFAYLRSRELGKDVTIKLPLDESMKELVDCLTPTPR